MGDTELILKMLKKNKGVITSAQVTSAGLQRRALSELVLAKRIYRVERGLYALSQTLEDEMYFLQYRYTKGIFSNGTALYLHGLSDKAPHAYTLTFPHGYNAAGLKNHNVKAKYATHTLYDMGVTEEQSPNGNPLRVYDVERTLCDVVKCNSGCDASLVNQAMKTYAASNTKDISRLLSYAERLRVKTKIHKYMEVLM